MFGLNFVQSGFLFAGLAAAIPVVIHLLLRQRARRVDIGSVRFLKRVLKEHNRMHRLREWLLLAARIVTTLLLALLFARPFLDRTAFEAGQREVIYLLDRSASTQFRRNEDSVLETAYDALLGELQQVHEQTVARFAVFDAEGIQEIDWEKRTERPTSSFAATDYGKALGWARDALQQSSRPDKEIVLFTDLQRSGIGPTQLGEFPANIKVQIRDHGPSMSKNVSIDRAVVTSHEIRPGMPPKIQVNIRNGGPIPVEKTKVQLELTAPDDRIVADSQTIALPGAGSETVTFQIQQAIPGIYTGKVQVTFEDELGFDNQRFVAFEARHPDRLLLVDGQEGSSVYGNETYYLQTALQVGQQTANRDVPSFEVERIVWDAGKGFPDLAGFRAILLANVGSFTTTDANRLKEYLVGGGRLLICCGDRFTRRVAQSLSESKILPCEVEGIASLGPYRISDWDKDHPIFGPFDDPQYGDLRRLRFEKIALLKPDPKASVLLATPAGQPLFIESTYGKGKVLVLATTIDTAWTQWPQGRLFVPLVRQIFGYMTDHHERDSRIEQSVATDKPGVLVDQERIVVANVAPEESELTRVTSEEFRKALNLPEKLELGDLTPEQLAALAPPAKSERPEEMWTTIAWVLLGWLVLETFLAGRVHA